jgi:hypothetical protein
MQTNVALWPLTYRGMGITLEALPDERYQGIAEDGYRSTPSADIVEALEEVTAYIDAQEGK